MTTYGGHDWQVGETIDEAHIQALDDAARDAIPRTEVAATYSALELQSLPITTSSAPVAVAADANLDNLWPGWYNAGQSTVVDLGAMTDPAAYGPWFYGGKGLRDTWWGGGPAIYNTLNVGTNPTWALCARITGSTRLLVGMNGAVGAETASKFLIEIDGQKLTRRYIDTGIVYDGHRTGLLLTFPDARPHDVRIWSKAGFTHAIVDPAGTVAPSPTPFGGKKRLVIAGDSWIEGTSQTGGAISLASMVQAACPEWNVAYLGNGGTGYANSGPSFASVFGSTARLAAMSGFAPDLWVFFGSINDSDAAAVQTAAAAAYASLASSNPAAKGIVIGPQLTGHDAVSAALAAAATAAPKVLGYIDPVAAGWVAPAGVVGPTDMQHPSAAGADHLANRIIAAIRRLTAMSGDMSW